jgi:carbohydrate kinase, thermoresistant glucokinase family
MKRKPAASPATIVVMGVSGSGKSTVMDALAKRLGWVTVEGDDFHPAANIEKMRSGQPLTDEDRWPWLAAIAAWIGEHEGAGRNAIVTCSALKRAYRDRLRQGHPSVWFAHLVAPSNVISDRLEQRRHHYMPASLLSSQLEVLEPLAPDEPGSAVPADGTPKETVDELLAAFRRRLT